MAFWRDRLVEIGVFDPTFRSAGDDVDICWRLQDAGYRIGFAAAALVWHRRRNTIQAYLRQQRGYGEAEGLLFFKHPSRFNLLGHSRWLGRIYTDFGPGILRRKPVIYGGPFGSGLFQTLYEPPASLLRHLPMTLEWNVIALLLTLAGIASYAVGAAVPALLGLGLILFGLSIGQAISTAFRVDVNGLPVWKSRLTVAPLTYLGPLVRAIARRGQRGAGFSRLKHFDLPRARRRPLPESPHRGFVLSYWSESGIEKETCINSMLGFLRPRMFPIVVDDGWKPWDVSIYRGIWARAEVQILCQNHGGSRRQIDVGVRLRQNLTAKLLKGLWGLGALVTFGLGLWSAGALFCALLVGTEVFLAHQAYRVGRNLEDAVEFSFASLPLTPLQAEEERGLSEE
jgi:hypothetical protein